jgi:hypothetical protein
MKEGQAPDAWEQLWCRQISHNRFELCCIPFFLYGLALGDEVRTGKGHWIKRVLKPSGHRTYRVLFGKSTEDGIRQRMAQELYGLGCYLEGYSENLLGVSAPDADIAQRTVECLETNERTGQLVYEMGN